MMSTKSRSGESVAALSDSVQIEFMCQELVKGCQAACRSLQPSLSKHGGIQRQQLQNVAFTAGQTGFITALVYMEGSDLYAAACLDQTLRLYNHRFRLQSVMHWDAGPWRNALLAVETNTERLPAPHMVPGWDTQRLAVIPVRTSSANTASL